MKRNNNRFRGNTIYSLNYKFDSVSAAGKFCGTALELIKKYNELAKEAHSNGNYVEMEVFRQYAEHYRKIVTEINERKTQFSDGQGGSQTQQSASEQEGSYEQENTSEREEMSENANNEPEINTQASEQTETAENVTEDTSEEKTPTEKAKRRKRTFTIVEVADKSASETTKEENVESKPRRRRVLRKVAEA